MQFIWTPRDANGEYLDGGKHYALHLPPDEPVKVFWSVVVYDLDSRSALQDGECSPCRSTYNARPNADGSVDLYFGPTAPRGDKRNWIRTVNGRRWFPCLRYYSPLEPFVDDAWAPGEIVEIPL